jgi:hypothetical protein
VIRDKRIATLGFLAYPCRPAQTKITPGQASKAKIRRDGRVVEGARLESVYTATYRGFEPLSLRHQLIQ